MSPKDIPSHPTARKSTGSTGSVQPDSAAPLRTRAEALARDRGGQLAEDLEELSSEVARRALHELRVHQIELEMQNEELRRAQVELEVSRARYFDLYDLAPVGYCTLSEPGLILEANLTVAKLLGVPRGVLVKQPLSRFVLPADQDIYYQHRRALLQTGDPQTWEMRVLKTDAAPFWVRVEAAIAQDSAGASVWRAVVSDIGVSKEAERLLRTATAELQEFAYALTHDLQEPVRMVVNFTQLLALEYAGELGEDADKYIAYSVEGALKVEALQRGLLDYLEATGRDREGILQIDCNQSLSNALLFHRTAIQQSGAVVTSGPLPTVAAKDQMMTQIFQNLIGNALKYRGPATPAIHVSAARSADGWLFSVEDNGIGLDPEDAEFVFGMFRRLHGNQIPGTGIGLAICRKLVERYGGRIWVESQVGHGAVFKFTLPAAGLA